MTPRPAVRYNERAMTIQSSAPLAVQMAGITKSFPGAPDGEYSLLVFRSTFANKTDSRETVTLEREADGNWRVIGYFVR